MNQDKSDYIPEARDKLRRRLNDSLGKNSVPCLDRLLNSSDIDGASPKPQLFSKKVLNINKSYDRSNYMNVGDITTKRLPERLMSPIQSPEGFKDETNMIEYKDLPKQIKLKAQQGRLPFTRRYGKERYGHDSEWLFKYQRDILHHVNQTEKDNDPDMCTRRFKAEVRKKRPNRSHNCSPSELPNVSMLNTQSQKSILDAILNQRDAQNSDRMFVNYDMSTPTRDPRHLAISRVKGKYPTHA